MDFRKGSPCQRPSEDQAPTAKRLRAGTTPGSPTAAAGAAGQGQGPAVDVRKALAEMKLSAKEVFAGNGGSCLPPFVTEEKLGALLQQLWVWAVQQGKVPADAPVNLPRLVLVAQWGLQRMRAGAVQGKEETANGSGSFGENAQEGPQEMGAAAKGPSRQEQKVGPSGEEGVAGAAAAAQVPQLHPTRDQAAAAAVGLESCETAFEITLNPKGPPLMTREASLSPTMDQEISLSPGDVVPCRQGQEAEQVQGSGDSVQAAAAGLEPQRPGDASLGQQQHSGDRGRASPRAAGDGNPAVSPAAAGALAKWISMRKSKQADAAQGEQGPQQVEAERQLPQQQPQQPKVQRPQPIRPVLSTASLQRASGGQSLTGHQQQHPMAPLPSRGNQAFKAGMPPKSAMTLPLALQTTAVERQQQQKDILFLLGDLTAAELGTQPAFTSALQEVLHSFDTELAAHGIAFHYTPAELRQACSFVVRQVDSGQKQWLAQDPVELFYVVLQGLGLVQHIEQKVQELHESIERKVARIAAATGAPGTVAAGDSPAGTGTGAPAGAAAVWGSMPGLLFGGGDVVKRSLGASSSRPVQPGEALHSYGSWEQHLSALQATGYGQAAAADSGEGQLQNPGSDPSTRAGSGNGSGDGGHGSAVGDGSAQQQQTASEIAAQLLEIMRTQLQAKQGRTS